MWISLVLDLEIKKNISVNFIHHFYIRIKFCSYKVYYVVKIGWTAEINLIWIEHFCCAKILHIQCWYLKQFYSRIPCYSFKLPLRFSRLILIHSRQHPWATAPSTYDSHLNCSRSLLTDESIHGIEFKRYPQCVPICSSRNSSYLHVSQSPTPLHPSKPLTFL